MVQSPVQCLKCQSALTGDVFNRGDLVPCPACQGDLQVEVFPAFFRPVTTGTTGEQIVIDSEASCFYHPEKKARVPCHGCGRFLCALCDCELNHQHYCPSCLETGRKKGRIKSLENERTLYDNIALALAVFPVVLIFGIYFTFITAPMALYIAFRHWNSPRSIVHRTKVRFVAAIILAIVELIAWAVLVYFIVMNIEE